MLMEEMRESKKNKNEIEINDKITIEQNIIYEIKYKSHQFFIMINKKDKHFKGMDISGEFSEEIIKYAEKYLFFDINDIICHLKQENNKISSILCDLFKKIKENMENVEKIG